MEPEFRTSEGPRLVLDPEAARLVLDPSAVRLLAPFLGRERSAAEVAREAGVPLNTLKYRLRQFERLGLVRRAGVERRRGRPVQTYAAPPALFVPFRVTPLEGAAYLNDVLFTAMHEPLVRSVGAAWQDAAGEGRELGLHVYRNSAGRVTRDIAPESGRPDGFFDALLEDDRPAVWNTGNVVSLSRAEAKAFQRGLVDLLRRFARVAADDGEERRPYIYRLALAPYVPPKG